MNKKTLSILVIVGSILATPVFALDFLHTLRLHTLRLDKHASVKPHTQISVKDEDYTDFSGSWSGICSMGDQEVPMDITIENDDTSLQMDGLELSTELLHTQSISANSGSEFRHSSLEWNSDRTHLIIKQVDLDKNHDEASPMNVIIAKTTLSMNGEQLSLQFKFIRYMDLQQKGHLTSCNCIFNKNSSSLIYSPKG